jgi:hypothetical protein
MSEKDQQKVIMKALLELYRVTAQIKQGQAIQGDRFHQGSSGFTVKEYSPQRGCAAPKRGQSPPALGIAQQKRGAPTQRPFHVLG